MVHLTPLVLVFTLAGSVHSHGALLDPLPTWNTPYSDTSQFCGTMEGPSVLPGAAYNTSPQDNAAAFTRQFQASSFKTLRDLVLANPSTCGSCGITNPNGTPRQINADGTVKWAHGSEGFISSHEGPCEVWCDTDRVFQNDNCARNAANGIVKIDVAKCKRAIHLVVYWLALHVPTWQIYLNCVRLAGDGGAAAPTPSNPQSAQPSYPSAPPSYPTAAPGQGPPSTAPEYTYYVEPGYESYSPSPLNPSAPYTPPASMAPPSNPSPPYAPPPSMAPPSPSTSSPPLAPPTNSAVAAWGQCGGQQYKGPTQCVTGQECRKWADAYSQCVPQDNPSGDLKTWAQCGGKAYSGPTKCKSSDTCMSKNDFYSQCIPK
ncbi:hypothetical protein H257_11271 [Aphanomyces astaci]|uniref:CBM1 domain-containing protein n=1 Tax=Aphanomyces astaci TaxID=112090 RepID=W4G4H5_APHAT|nr:hypothetical protein H257_11271 [Aphanomyces astaci]ETV73954.1 hypothetical protein H257_11271 [Aphanomyces astaci]|eukprot:XP_009836467.1 hypothetical protein H257_11271 [Aphanomyces astaci]